MDIQAYKLTEDSKTRAYKGHFNTFGFMYGLPKNGGTCPGATCGKGGCLSLKTAGGKVKTCYVDHLVRFRAGMKNKLKENTKNQPEDKNEKVEKFDKTFQLFKLSTPKEYWQFRLYYSGDIIDVKTAEALAIAVNRHPDIKFWIYTRSLFAVSKLVKCKNLQIYISMDPVNYDKAMATFKRYSKYTNLALAWMGNENPDNQAWVKCPSTDNRFKVRLAPDQGACAKCKICFTEHRNRTNIRFPIH